MRSDERDTLWRLTRGHRGRYVAAIVALAASIAFLFGVPLVTQAAIDGALTGSAKTNWLRGFAGDPTRTLLLGGALTVLLTTLGGVCHYLRGRWSAQAAEAIVQKVRDRIYSHTARLPLAYHDRVDTGDLVQRSTSDVETVRAFLASQVVEIGRALLLVGIVLPILCTIHAGMALAAVALMPPIVIIAVVFFRRIQRLFLEMDEAEGRMTTVLQENLTGIRVVRAFARQDFESRKFGARNAEFRDLHNRLIRLLGVYWAGSDFLCVAQIGVVLVFGAKLAQSGALTVGELFAFLQYEALVIWPVRHMGRVLSETGKALVALRRIGEVLREEPERDPANPVEVAACRGRIEIDGVHFCYPGAAPALEDVSAVVEPGETLALVGAPGAGKSTIVRLLLRLYDYEAGSIRIDGVELRDMRRDDVRSLFGVVLQEPFLYSKTIAANLRVGRTSAAHQELVASTSAACVHDAIDGFEAGYETLLGERGVTLSGGQRQRLAIARALLKEAPILVLDDALSAVDTRTEREILHALTERRGRKTTLLIAHRLSTIEHADKVLVLEGGRVVQAGTHADLIEREGTYRRLWQIQGGAA